MNKKSMDHITLVVRGKEMKTNYGIHELRSCYEALIEHFNGAVSEMTSAEMACNAFLAEAFELEVTKHGGLDSEKIEEYKALCREFLENQKEIAEDRDI